MLLLRSFKDDESIAYQRSNYEIGDPSFESRISAHFFGMGPFIAVNAQKNVLPVGGATRATLTNSEWQDKVVEWIDSAALVVIMAGVTSWVNWEIKKVIERGHTHKMILCFPPSKTKLFAKDKRFRTLKRDSSARLEAVKAAFEGTPWEAQLCQLDNPQHIRTIVFEKGGRVTVVIARPRNQNGYHLAVLIVHFLLVQNNVTNPSIKKSDIKAETK